MLNFDMKIVSGRLAMLNWAIGVYKGLSDILPVNPLNLGAGVQYEGTPLRYVNEKTRYLWVYHRKIDQMMKYELQTGFGVMCSTETIKTKERRDRAFLQVRNMATQNLPGEDFCEADVVVGNDTRCVYTDSVAPLWHLIENLSMEYAGLFSHRPVNTVIHQLEKNAILRTRLDSYLSTLQCPDVSYDRMDVIPMLAHPDMDLPDPEAERIMEGVNALLMNADEEDRTIRLAHWDNRYQVLIVNDRFNPRVVDSMGLQTCKGVIWTKVSPDVLKMCVEPALTVV